MLTDWGRRNLRPVFESIAVLLHRLHLTPNVITLLGLLLSIGTAVLIISDRLLAAGLLYIIGAGSDAIDGTLARLTDSRSKFGAFWDSTLDRLGESIVVAAIGYWAALQGDMTGLIIAFVALTASFLVSYTRARAEGLGLQCNVGIGTRVERFLILVVALVIGYPVYGLALIATLAAITVVQRIYFVWRQTRQT